MYMNVHAVTHSYSKLTYMYVATTNNRESRRHVQMCTVSPCACACMYLPAAAVLIQLAAQQTILTLCDVEFRLKR